MNLSYYNLIVALPAVLTSYLPVLVLLMIPNRQRVLLLVANYAFSRIMTKKTDNRGTTSWLFKDIDLTNEKKILFKVSLGLFLLFFALLAGVLSLFFHILFIDVTYSCDPNDTTKDCFEFKLGSTEKLSWQDHEPIDCNSTAIQNGTMEVVCYKLVFNFGLALGASYGTFQFSLFVLNMATSGLLIVKQANTIHKLRTITIFLLAASLVAILRVQSSSLSRSLSLPDALQITVFLGIGICFVYVIPWKDLIALKKAQNESGTVGVENIGVEAT